MKLTKREKYLKKLNKQIKKLSKLRDILTDEVDINVSKKDKVNKVKSDKKDIPDYILKTQDLFKRLDNLENRIKLTPTKTETLRETLREKIKYIPLSSKEFKEKMFAGTTPLNLIMDKCYEDNKNTLLQHSDTIESITANTICYSPNDTHMKIGGDLLTMKPTERSTPVRPRDITEEDEKIIADQKEKVEKEAKIKMLTNMLTAPEYRKK